jgi:hypothetical protein
MAEAERQLVALHSDFGTAPPHIPTANLLLSEQIQNIIMRA